jgi:hypothetical protein
LIVDFYQNEKMFESLYYVASSVRRRQIMAAQADGHSMHTYEMMARDRSERWGFAAI